MRGRHGELSALQRRRGFMPDFDKLVFLAHEEVGKNWKLF